MLKCTGELDRGRQSKLMWLVTLKVLRGCPQFNEGKNPKFEGQESIHRPRFPSQIFPLQRAMCLMTLGTLQEFPGRERRHSLICLKEVCIALQKLAFGQPVESWDLP